MRKRTARLAIGGGLFLFSLDRWLKWQAIHQWNGDKLIQRWLGWHPFNNPGAAFGLPVPSWLVISFTIPIIVYIAYRISCIMYHVSCNGKGKDNSPNKLYAKHYTLHVLGLAAILVGALSNLIDRLLYGYTIDYWLIFTGVFNLGDALIIAGGAVYLYSHKVSRLAAGHNN